MKQLGGPEFVMYTKEPGASREVLNILHMLLLIMIKLLLFLLLITTIR